MNFTKEGTRTINFTLYKTDIQRLRKEWKEYVRHIPEYPTDKFKGKGIVMCAGKINYFTCCWISVNMLRKQKCTLPIEVWYTDEELSTDAIEALKKLNIICKNTLDYTDKRLSGWALKPFSILHSSFKDILFLDADNISLENPERLFSIIEFEQFGTVFWPDFWQTDFSNPMWTIAGVKPSNTPEQESGQLLIDKQKCWKELNLCYFFNCRGNVFYYLLYGDKDTFRFSWLALRKEFYMIKRAPALCGYEDKSTNAFLGIAIVQYLDNKPFFIHRNLLKWDVTFPEERVWIKVKQFRPNAINKEFFLQGNIRNGHHYMNIEGDTEIHVSSKAIQALEDSCMKVLHKLRVSSFYRNFIDYRYRIENRIEKYNPDMYKQI